MAVSRSVFDLDPVFILESRYGARLRAGSRRDPPAPVRTPRQWQTPAPIATGPELESAAAAMPSTAVRALTRLTHGPTPQDIALFKALGANATERLGYYVDWQLAWQDIDDSALESRLSAAGYATLGKTGNQLWRQHALSQDSAVRMQPGREVQRARFVRAIHSKRQLLEVMTDFWHDHFNVYGNSWDTAPVLPAYDRMLRRNAFGNFRVMLEQVARSTAMLYYLDNVYNSRSGPNENWARELLELHTLGAENYFVFMNPFEVPPDSEDPAFPAGYTDIDVYETAAAFTGWTVRNGHWQFPNENDGAFVYRSSWHDQGPKFVLGMLLYPEQPALADGQQILDRLARHPKVARSVCRKLIERLVGKVPEDLLTSAAQVFRSHVRSNDQIARTVRHIVLSETFRGTWATKVRRPFECVAAALRAVPPDATIRQGHARSDDLMWLMSFTGNLPFNWAAPDGYPDTKEAWLGSNSLAMTWRVLNWLTAARDGDDEFLPIVRLSRQQVPQWTAAALVSYWSQRLLGYPLEGGPRNVLAAFMAQNGDPVRTVIEDSDVWSGNDLKRHYNHQRLRSMVSLIMMNPEFFRS